MMAQIVMKKKRIINISLSMTKDWKIAFNILLSDLTFATVFKTLSTLKGFMFKFEEIFCKKLTIIIIKSNMFQFEFKYADLPKKNLSYRITLKKIFWLAPLPHKNIKKNHR